jgi:mannose-6-phosphate isomerase-like protein (cupin superfamily)
MKIKRFKDLEFIPASHEDPKNPGVLKKVLFIKDELLKGRVQMINWALLPIGKSFQKHYHEDMEEIFIMFTGIALMSVDNQEETIEKGDCVIVPPKSTHTMKNIGKIDIEYMVVGITSEQNGKTIVVVE